MATFLFIAVILAAGWKVDRASGRQRWPVGTGAIETPPRWGEEDTGRERGGVTWSTVMEASGYCDGGGAYRPQVPMLTWVPGEASVCLLPSSVL